MMDRCVECSSNVKKTDNAHEQMMIRKAAKDDAWQMEGHCFKIRLIFSRRQVRKR